MLALTENAADVIKKLVADAELNDGGLRITAELDENREAGLILEMANGAADGDETVEEHGATVYLDEVASVALADKMLDAEPHADHVHFSIEDPPAVA